MQKTIIKNGMEYRHRGKGYKPVYAIAATAKSSKEGILKKSYAMRHEQPAGGVSMSKCKNCGHKLIQDNYQVWFHHKQVTQVWFHHKQVTNELYKDCQVRNPKNNNSWNDKCDCTNPEPELKK